jgi:hypothetical protein
LIAALVITFIKAERIIGIGSLGFPVGGAAEISVKGSSARLAGRGQAGRWLRAPRDHRIVRGLSNYRLERGWNRPK